MTKRLLSLFLAFFSGLFCYGQSGCSGCAIRLPESLAADTIFLSQAPNGQVGTFYKEDISFRLPKSTDAVVDIEPTAPPGLPISKVTITGVSNLPPGLSWEANKMEFNTSNETDGCLRFCGLPLQPGLYFVEISITVRVIVVNETASVRIPILIEPAERVTDGFKMTNNFGCGNAEVSFQNNVPSNGKDGYSYFWNFGNGDTSTEENPGNQNYDLPGTYALQYQALIDTTGYFLTQININSVGCNDLFGGRPDLKVNVLDPDNNLIWITDLITNAQTPVSYQLNLKLDPGTYVLEVFDADNGLGGADDFCGSVSINQNTSGSLSDGNLSLSVEILHPVDTITSSDTVFVFEQPEPPLITQTAQDPICEGDTVLLTTDFSENVQWYQDGSAILMGTDDSLFVTQVGEYWASYTSPDGCISTSAVETISFEAVPQSIAFVNENNILSLSDSSMLPEQARIRWFQDGVLLEGVNDTTYCIDADGIYTIEVTDLSTGCQATYSQAITYDPNFPLCDFPVVEGLPNGVTSVQLFPNPTYGPLNFLVKASEIKRVQVSLHTITGQQLRMEHWDLTPGVQREEWDLLGLPAGMYVIRLSSDGRGVSWRVVKL